MLDEGFLEHSPELRLTFPKEELRVIANAILDIRLQMLNMTDQEALDLMQKQTFQEAEEATAKLQRAKLSSAQLPAYFVGWRGWLDVRDKYQQKKGAASTWRNFNDAALKQGAVPLPELLPICLQQAPGRLAGSAAFAPPASVIYNVVRSLRGMPEIHRRYLQGLFRTEPPPAPKPGFNPISWMRDLAFSVLIAIVLIVFIYQPVKVEGTSMMPALSDQERIFINKFTYRFGIGSIERGDMVVFWFPLDTSKSYIKRVIGLPGDTVEIDHGTVIVNGQPMTRITCRRNTATTNVPGRRTDPARIIFRPGGSPQFLKRQPCLGHGAA